MLKEKTTIIVPGLGDEISWLKLLTLHWQLVGVNVVFCQLNWRDQQPFQPKLKKLAKVIGDLTRQGHQVSLVGTSAGGSAVLNAFLENSDLVHRVANVCGRLKVGSTSGLRAFSKKTSTSPAFAESVELFESREHFLTDLQRSKILTVRPFFGDELVPADTVSVRGARNIVIPSIEHALSIGLALSLFSSPLLAFLQEE